MRKTNAWKYIEPSKIIMRLIQTFFIVFYYLKHSAVLLFKFVFKNQIGNIIAFGNTVYCFCFSTTVDPQGALLVDLTVCNTLWRSAEKTILWFDSLSAVGLRSPHPEELHLNSALLFLTKCKLFYKNISFTSIKNLTTNFFFLFPLFNEALQRLTCTWKLQLSQAL